MSWGQIYELLSDRQFREAVVDELGREEGEYKTYIPTPHNLGWADFYRDLSTALHDDHYIFPLAQREENAIYLAVARNASLIERIARHYSDIPAIATVNRSTSPFSSLKPASEPRTITIADPRGRQTVLERQVPVIKGVTEIDANKLKDGSYNTWHDDLLIRFDYEGYVISVLADGPDERLVRPSEDLHADPGSSNGNDEQWTNLLLTYVLPLLDMKRLGFFRHEIGVFEDLRIVNGFSPAGLPIYKKLLAFYTTLGSNGRQDWTQLVVSKNNIYPDIINPRIPFDLLRTVRINFQRMLETLRTLGVVPYMREPNEFGNYPDFGYPEANKRTGDVSLGEGTLPYIVDADKYPATADELDRLAHLAVPKQHHYSYVPDFRFQHVAVRHPSASEIITLPDGSHDSRPALYEFDRDLERMAMYSRILDKRIGIQGPIPREIAERAYEELIHYMSYGTMKSEYADVMRSHKDVVIEAVRFYVQSAPRDPSIAYFLTQYLPPILIDAISSNAEDMVMVGKTAVTDLGTWGGRHMFEDIINFSGTDAQKEIIRSDGYKRTISRILYFYYNRFFYHGDYDFLRYGFESIFRGPEETWVQNAKALIDEVDMSRRDVHKMWEYWKGRFNKPRAARRGGAGGTRGMRGGPVMYMLPPAMIGMSTMQMGAQVALLGPNLGMGMPFTPQIVL